MKKNNIQNLTFTALMAAVLCITGPIVIPIGMVPMSFVNMAIYLTVLLLDKKRAAISVAIYLLMGFVGLPVFAGFTGGAGKIFGPTGGYLMGYLILTWTAGIILEKKMIPQRSMEQVVALTVGTLGLYLFGTLWLMVQAKLPAETAIAVGVLPFVLPDILKIYMAVWLGKKLNTLINLT